MPSKDIIESWIEIGINDLNNGQFFNAFQTLLGAINRAFRTNNMEKAEEIIKTSLPLFVEKNKTNLACDLSEAFISQLYKSQQNSIYCSKYTQLLFVLLDELKLNDCLFSIRNRIINLIKTLDEVNVSILEDSLHDPSLSSEVRFHISCCLAGYFLAKKNFEKTFYILEDYYNLLENVDVKLLTYLTLAELNAFEVEGTSNFLPQINERKQLDGHDKQYFQLVNDLSASVLTNNYSEYRSIIQSKEYSRLFDSDHLLRMMVFSLNDVFNKGKTGSFFPFF